MFGPGVKITRFHSDRGNEFVNNDMARMLREKNILQTTTEGHDPKH